jgi:putative FmdB family regulatory protein
MALYDYRCDEHGVFEVARPLATAPGTITCPACGSESRRVFSSPMVSFAPRPLVAALEHEEKTRHEPDIVTSLPAALAHRRTPVLPLTPTLRRLPRP